MICNNTEMKVKELISQGKKENIDFRVVYFSSSSEIQMVRK